MFILVCIYVANIGVSFIEAKEKESLNVVSQIFKIFRDKMWYRITLEKAQCQNMFVGVSEISSWSNYSSSPIILFYILDLFESWATSGMFSGWNHGAGRSLPGNHWPMVNGFASNSMQTIFQEIQETAKFWWGAASLQSPWFLSASIFLPLGSSFLEKVPKRKKLIRNRPLFQWMITFIR